MKTLPHQPGVYLFKNKANTTIYVGKARDLKKRVASYFNQAITTGARTKKMVSEIVSVDHVVTETEMEALLLEADLIKRLKPKYNHRLKDDKYYQYLKITTNEDYPRIMTTRSQRQDGAKYFGPFPEGTVVYQIIHDLRVMFGFCNEHKKTGKPCFYYHLQLCPGPCAGMISQAEYRKHINRIIQFLAGKKARVLACLNKEMEQAAKHKDFEQAAVIRDKIKRIEYITQKFHSSEEYLANPNLSSDLREQELTELINVLQSHGLSITRKNKFTGSFRIEAYDLSNTSGTNATGAMVVFIDGEAKKDAYRRFKITFTSGQSDTDFLGEVLTRRFQAKTAKSTDSSFTQLPKLILVDGGIPQVNTSIKVLQLKGLNIPLVGLAKRWEVIVLPTGNQIKLPRDSLALQLLQRMRDEAHRFAKSYHVSLRNKTLVN